MICGSLEWAVGSIGGFCVGTTYITDHQVLSGLGELCYIDTVFKQGFNLSRGSNMLF